MGLAPGCRLLHLADMVGQVHLDVGERQALAVVDDTLAEPRQREEALAEGVTQALVKIEETDNESRA